MKFVIATALIVLASHQAKAVEKCKFHLNDLTKDELVVSADTKDGALEKAAMKCFDMYESANVRRSGHGLANDDQGVSIVNACANVRCS